MGQLGGAAHLVNDPSVTNSQSHRPNLGVRYPSSLHLRKIYRVRKLRDDCRGQIESIAGLLASRA